MNYIHVPLILWSSFSPVSTDRDILSPTIRDHDFPLVLSLIHNLHTEELDSITAIELRRREGDDFNVFG